MPQQSDPPTLVTAADISRLADVTRATVSNWRRRHADFPSPVGGTEASPVYDVREVEVWLAGRGQLPAASPVDAFKAELRRRTAGDELVGRLNLAVLGAVRLGAEGQEKVLALADPALVRAVGRAIRDHAETGSDSGETAGFEKRDAPVLRALVRCVREVGGPAALDALAERTPTDTGARGVYATPALLVDLMADLASGAGDAYPKSVFDPACGSGGLLAAAARRGSVDMYGQDAVLSQVGQAVARLGILSLVTDVASTTSSTASSSPPSLAVRVEGGDSLRQDAFPEIEAGAVLCNPPYGDRDWGYGELAYDARWEYGVPPKGEPELAWVQHCLAHLESGGYAVLALPPGTAERASGRRIRAELVRRGAVRAVIALPSGIAQPLHVGLHVWVLRRPAQEGPDTSTVLFLDAAAIDAPASTADSRSAGSATAKDRTPDRLRAAVRRYWHAFATAPDSFESEPGIAHAVSVVDLLDEVTDLTPARHTRSAAIAISPARFAERARQAGTELSRAVAALAERSGEQQWPPAGEQARNWRTATVADLTRGVALTVHRTTGTGRATRATRAAGVTSRRAEAAAGLRVLTARDVASGSPASGTSDDAPGAAAVEIQRGDVLLPEMLHGQTTNSGFRIADDQDAGSLLGPNLWLFRPDPTRLDPWFLAGFLAAEENVHSVATGSTVMRVDARRLRVPLLPPAEQRAYGDAFRHLHALRAAATEAARLATDTAQDLASGLTGGILLPPVADIGSSTP
ncbi:N-6 DNA methylase [Streptomyces sioyaensis]|uniref:N-6 DNA methylase n=1 Tax=Streptomyces sioyaensis TaxID=67364 RepID=UPI003D71D555